MAGFLQRLVARGSRGHGMSCAEMACLVQGESDNA